MSTDEELGFDPKYAHIASDRLRQPVQNIIDNFDLSVILLSLSEAFFGCLKTAGASQWNIEKWAKKLLKFTEKRSHNAIQSAYVELSEPIKKMVQEENISPLAIAFSMSTFIASIIRQHPAVSDEKADELLANLIAHIDSLK